METKTPTTMKLSDLIAKNAEEAVHTGRVKLPTPKDLVEALGGVLQGQAVKLGGEIALAEIPDTGKWYLTTTKDGKRKFAVLSDSGYNSSPIAGLKKFGRWTLCYRLSITAYCDPDK